MMWPELLAVKRGLRLRDHDPNAEVQSWPPRFSLRLTSRRVPFATLAFSRQRLHRMWPLGPFWDSHCSSSLASGPSNSSGCGARETGARPHLLKLELTESLVLDNVDDTIAKMGLLKTKGVRFSVDDFGTGYSSLAYLTRLPLDQLKIDQSFVRNLGVRHTDDVIVQTIIGMARNLELDVIAEGVETAQQKALLADYGCQLFQGYLLGMPGPVSELEVLLQQAATQASAEGAAG